ncbi:DUF6019 family protein [Enterococcus massiliensis]|uniref:DUF6019 family protein n=1 Tax=Enterococcus massiliensis TaxID=1640685 RepID=UPI000A492688|nr:DUF6019 family protein [Enterococcus massiliensis]
MSYVVTSEKGSGLVFLSFFISTLLLVGLFVVLYFVVKAAVRNGIKEAKKSDNDQQNSD